MDVRGFLFTSDRAHGAGELGRGVAELWQGHPGLTCSKHSSGAAGVWNHQCCARDSVLSGALCCIMHLADCYMSGSACTPACALVRPQMFGKKISGQKTQKLFMTPAVTSAVAPSARNFQEVQQVWRVVGGGIGARPHAARPARFQRAALAAYLSMLCAHAFIPLLMRLCSWLVLPTTPPCASLFWVLVLPTTPAVRFSLLGALLSSGFSHCPCPQSANRIVGLKQMNSSAFGMPL